jgi:glutamate--cysteine ligase
MTWNTAFAERFGRAFKSRDSRTVGREAEHPIVHGDGSAADVSVLWDALSEGMEIVREGEQIVLLQGPDYAYSAEVGRATIEIITEPRPDLHALNACYEAAMSRLLEVTSGHGLEVLGYGIQPLTPATVALQTPKQRYGVLWEVLGDPWLWFTLTASDQIHVSVDRRELMAMTNLANLLAPVTVGLCANSPVYAGVYSGFASAREGHMGEIHADRYRHGMPGGPSPDLQDWIRRLAAQPFLMDKRDGIAFPESGSFADWMAREPRDDEQAWTAFLLHEHYIWNTARPRSGHGTLELRSAGQQPWESHWAAGALSLGIVEAGVEIAEFMVFELDDPWAVCRAWHREVVRNGLSEPVDGLLVGILERCRDGLRGRGLGEERLLDPLFERVATGANPAKQALAAFEAGGISGLVAHTRIQSAS